MSITNIAALIAMITAAADVGSETERSLKLKSSIAYGELAKILSDARNGIRLIDVRTAEEYAEGHIPGAELIPYTDIEESFSESRKDRPIVVYCRSGRRSEIAADTLRTLGYTNVSDFGSVSDWKGKLTKGEKP